VVAGSAGSAAAVTASALLALRPAGDAGFPTDPVVLPEAEGRELFDVLNANLGLLVPAIVGTQLAIALGVLVALVGTLLSRTMPRGLSIAGIGYVVVFAGLPAFNHAVTVIGYLLQVALVAAIGWFGLRAALTR
jgi:hypothetical protein